MKTVKLPIINQIDIDDMRRIYSSVVRFSYNRFIDGLREKEIRSIIKEKSFSLNSWLIQCGIKEAQSIYDRNKGKKVIFGGKFNYLKRLQNKISREEYRENRLLPITIQGETCKKGNRLFSLDIIENNRITFKESRNNHIIIQLPKLRKNIKKELVQLERLSKDSETNYTIKLTNECIYISYDEKILSRRINQFSNRVLGIDLNPNYLGYSVLNFKGDDFELLHKEVFDFTKLTEKSGKPSQDEQNKYSVNKHHTEIYNCIRRVINTAIHYRVSKIVLEDLSVRNKNHGKGKIFNRLVNNKWNKNKYIESLKKWCNIYDIELVVVNPAYSSVIGNLQYCQEYKVPDMIGASIEIARRGYKKFEKNWFYPVFNMEQLRNLNHWKKEDFLNINNWKELYCKIKNMKLKYRVQLSDTIINAVLSKYNIKSKVILYNF